MLIGVYGHLQQINLQRGSFAAASFKKLQVVAPSGHCKWLILLQVAAASGKVASGFNYAETNVCSKATCSISCKLPKNGGSVQTRSLQVDLLQVPIQRSSEQKVDHVEKKSKSIIN